MFFCEFCEIFKNTVFYGTHVVSKLYGELKFNYFIAVA